MLPHLIKDCMFKVLNAEKLHLKPVKAVERRIYNIFINDIKYYMMHIVIAFKTMNINFV